MRDIQSEALSKFNKHVTKQKVYQITGILNY